jgi:hypothetical protein
VKESSSGGKNGASLKLKFFGNKEKTLSSTKMVEICSQFYSVSVHLCVYTECPK